MIERAVAADATGVKKLETDLEDNIKVCGKFPTLDTVLSPAGNLHTEPFPSHTQPKRLPLAAALEALLLPCPGRAMCACVSQYVSK